VYYTFVLARSYQFVSVFPRFLSSLANVSQLEIASRPKYLYTKCIK